MAKLPKEARYLLVTYMLPEATTMVALTNPELMGGMMFVAGPETLRDLVKDQIGATPVIVAVYSTASSGLWGHIHVHLVISAGGLTRDGRWVAYPRRRFVLPEAARERFRASLVSQFMDLRRRETLSLRGNALRALRESPDALWDLLQEIPPYAWTPDIRRVHTEDLLHVLRYLAGHFSPFQRRRTTSV